MKETRRQYQVTQFEMVFPRLMEMVCSGWDLSKAIRDLPIELDVGLFMRWMNKDSDRVKIYKESKEIRAEVWTGRLLDHATGDTLETNEVARDTLAVNAYKWLIGAHNRREYGDTKQIEVTQSISIRAALEQGTTRISQVIDAEVVDDELEHKSAYKQLSAPVDVEYEDDDE